MRLNVLFDTYDEKDRSQLMYKVALLVWACCKKEKSVISTYSDVPLCSTRVSFYIS